MVQVEKHQRDFMLMPLGTLQCLFQIGDEPQAIRQARQGVVMCQVSQAILRFFDRANIGEYRNIVRDTPMLILDRRDVFPRRIDLAAFSPIPDLTTPLPFAFKRTPDRVIKRLIVTTRLLNARILA